jgi:hypothetical protein
VSDALFLLVVLVGVVVWGAAVTGGAMLIASGVGLVPALAFGFAAVYVTVLIGARITR